MIDRFNRRQFLQALISSVVAAKAQLPIGLGKLQNGGVANWKEIPPGTYQATIEYVIVGPPGKSLSIGFKPVRQLGETLVHTLWKDASDVHETRKKSQ